MNRRIALALIGAGLWLASMVVPAAGAVPGQAPAGPPFPGPVVDQAVYDEAGILSPETIARSESTIDAIEARTGAEIVVYSQLVDYGVETSETEARARALIDQWGIGRAGFDDGMVIFFDIDPSGEHGQVELYAAPGFEATYLTNADRQAIFEDEMVPYLQAADFDGAVQIALQRVDAAVTPEHAAQLQTARQVNAAVGLVGAPIVFLGLAGWAFTAWRRYGRDPIYLDDPSILMPAPPPDLTAAAGAFVVEGGATRRALTTAMLDLASRGLICFGRTVVFSVSVTRWGSTWIRPLATPLKKRSASAIRDVRSARPRSSPWASCASWHRAKPRTGSSQRICPASARPWARSIRRWSDTSSIMAGSWSDPARSWVAGRGGACSRSSSVSSLSLPASV